MRSGDTEFGRELEVFRTEEEIAQQYFFSYLAIRDLAARDDAVLDCLNTAPLFWITTENSLLLAAFVALGRIFDQRSRHNIDKLLNIGLNDLAIFSRTNLALRKQADGLATEMAEAYVADTFEPSAADFRALRKIVAGLRRAYEARYRDIRDKIFAHKELARQDMQKLFQKTNIDEMKSVFSTLHALHDALWELLFNGRKPNMNVRTIDLPNPGVAANKGMFIPGEQVAREAIDFLTSAAGSMRAAP